MKKIYRLIILSAFFSGIALDLHAQQSLEGRVRNDKGDPVAYATVRLQGAGRQQQADRAGCFTLPWPGTPDTLAVSAVGYRTERLPIDRGGAVLEIVLSQGHELSEVVVSTGYESVAVEKTTGAFVQIGRKLLERTVSTDFVGRLEGLVPGLQFRNTYSGENIRDPHLRVRGTGTINSSEQPLVVIDNFAYDGSLSDIHPGDIESVTVLKDAAAASIWGARAANGVIVVKTKGSNQSTTGINFTSSLARRDRPDLFYDRNYIGAGDWMEVEKELFTKGNYRERNNVLLSPYVEQLIAFREGDIDGEQLRQYEKWLSAQDVRRDARRYLYRPAYDQQYALNLSGRNKVHGYYLSLGYDNNLSNTVGDDYRRVTVNLKNSLTLARGLTALVEGYYTYRRARQNGTDMNGIAPTATSLYPYTRLADDSGLPLGVPYTHRLSYVEDAVDNGFLPWDYTPLKEVELSDRGSRHNTLRSNLELRYRPLPFMDMQLQYQYMQGDTRQHLLHHRDSYYVRNLVNRFQQSDGTRPVPHGYIFQESSLLQKQQTARLQTNYSHSFGQHGLRGLMGAEIREMLSLQDPGYQLYNYNPENLTASTEFDYTSAYVVNPSGGARIPAPSAVGRQNTDRYLSYYANSNYTYMDRYIWSGSLRWDGSNLFGVRSNQKGVPLWSTGLSWKLSDEPFWNSTWLPELRIRGTYGVNGNVNKSVTAFPTVLYTRDTRTTLPIGILRSAGNPSLRWEQVRSWNIGGEFALLDRRLWGTVDWYARKGTDLIGERYMDPTTGISGTEIANLINYAQIVSRGADIVLNYRHTRGAFSYLGSANLTLARNRVVDYDVKDSPSVFDFLGDPSVPVIGQSKDVVYAFPWHGLSAENGQIMVGDAGGLHQDYGSYFNTVGREDLQRMGTSVPVMQLYVRNDLSWRQLTFSFQVGYKAGYVFRRSSIDYAQLFERGAGHVDYTDRWQVPGDEGRTTVPSRPGDVNRNRDQAYAYSSVLVDRGDHIRLKDVRVDYTWGALGLFVFINNPGVLWRANNVQIDPDYAAARYPQPTTYSFGMYYTIRK